MLEEEPDSGEGDVGIDGREQQTEGRGMCSTVVWFVLCFFVFLKLL